LPPHCCRPRLAAGLWGGETLASYLARRAVNPNVLPNNAASPNGVLGQSAIGFIGGTPYESRASEQRARQGAFATLSASVTWTDPSDHYYVRVWGTNLTDVTYRVHYRPSSGTYIPIGEPMSFGGTIGCKFR